MKQIFDRETYDYVIEEELSKLNHMVCSAHEAKEAIKKHGNLEEPYWADKYTRAVARWAALEDLMDAMSAARNPKFQNTRKLQEEVMTIKSN